ncbi:hypothetical protein L1049_013111 [Liquidambar formosana]|uniref:EGF-like domain-containing protein n=1 Tax=Liquidambar formosana TaxID=63359 RepID=A0AAP0RK19_LIQFO
MYNVSNFLHVLLLSLFLGQISVNSLPCDDTRCKTGSCDSTGSCICDLPDPSTILDGDRPLLGGKFCDEEQIMCDGTNSFWCEHGGTCEEIVQGENYTCKCLPGYAGAHCEHLGMPCGRIFCFHEAECLVEGDACKCPPDWEGTIDCSLPIQTHSDFATNSTAATRLPQEQSSISTNWLVVVLAISCSVGAVVGAVICKKKFFSKKKASVPKFQQLSQMQTYGILDDDDEGDSMIPDVIHDDKSHL